LPHASSQIHDLPTTQDIHFPRTGLRCTRYTCNQILHYIMPTLPTWDLPAILPKGLPLSLVGVVATIMLGIAYSVIAKERPLAGFPMYKKDGKDPKSSYLWHGRRDFLQAARIVGISSLTLPSAGRTIWN
jgi:hypothetical protein